MFPVTTSVRQKELINEKVAELSKEFTKFKTSRLQFGIGAQRITQQNQMRRHGIVIGGGGRIEDLSSEDSTFQRLPSHEYSRE